MNLVHARWSPRGLLHLQWDETVDQCTVLIIYFPNKSADLGKKQFRMGPPQILAEAGAAIKPTEKQQQTLTQNAY